jgi:hypothetical protein
MLHQRLAQLAADVSLAYEALDASYTQRLGPSGPEIVSLTLWRLCTEVVGLSHRVLAVSEDVSPADWPPVWGPLTTDVQHLAEDCRRALMAARGALLDLERSDRAAPSETKVTSPEPFPFDLLQTQLLQHLFAEGAMRDVNLVAAACPTVDSSRALAAVSSLLGRGVVKVCGEGEVDLDPHARALMLLGAAPNASLTDKTRALLQELEQELWAAAGTLPNTPLGVGYVDEDLPELEGALRATGEAIHAAKGHLHALKGVLHVE